MDVNNKRGEVFPDPFLNSLDEEGLKFLYYLISLSDKEVYKMSSECSISDLWKEPILRWESSRRMHHHREKKILKVMGILEKKRLNEIQESSL